MIELLKTWSRDFAITVQVVTSIAQLIVAVVLFCITRRYVAYTSQLVQSQIIPQVSLDIPSWAGAEIIVTNDGAQPVVNLRIALEELRFFETKRGPVGASQSKNPGLWAQAKLAAGGRAECRIGELARDALIMAENERQMWGQNLSEGSSGLMGIDDVKIYHVFSFTLSFEREVDRHRFQTQRQFLITKAPPDNQPWFLPLGMVSRTPSFREYCDGKGISLPEKDRPTA